MRYAEAELGRVFVIRLEQDEVIHEKLESFAASKGISAAACIILGAAEKGSRVVVGPEDGRARPVTPLEFLLDEGHEITGTGTIFPDENGRPMLHMHMAYGRGKSTITGCLRRGVKIWQVGEVILFELRGSPARRELDKRVGFHLMEPN